ncbi:fucose 4-O-acetylase-like acetyltransferase [Erwinia toletana]|uniref:Fucose 4-O-acetylase-like acetyltransferase n=1 Tax=Winslowiella toletana TaxID=92490 RepID=A0ABS4P2U6_9GAMM|nr:acyltransferase [Winslowiella toletana]MBP2166981.1 fucose 4-O-acetylase-like acetyltransferase [Winslowiella toletana]
MRDLWVDYAKGIGIALVVFGHVNRGLYSSGVYLSEGAYTLVDSIIYSFHMPLFFFLAGLFFLQSIERKGKKEFIVSKADTIVYPYVVWSLIQGGIEVVLSNYTNSKTSLGEVLAFLIYPRAQFWFLYALFMIFAVAAVLWHRKYFNQYLPYLLILSLVMNVWQEELTNNFHLDFITNYLFFFMLGILFYKVSGKITANANEVVFGGVAILFILSQYLFHWGLGYTYTHTGMLSVLLAVISIGFIVMLASMLSKMDLKLFRILGELSMYIYLMHILAGSGMRIVLNKVLHTNSWTAHVLFGTLAGIIVPVIAVYVLKRWRADFLFSRPRLSIKKKSYI